MDIKEYFARMCAAGLMQPYENIFASSLVGNKWQIEMWNGNSPIEHEIDLFIVNCKSDPLDPEQILLRENGVNLYELEWRKPTEQDVGKYVWMYSVRNNALQKIIFDKDILDYKTICKNNYWLYLLADHGQIAPTEQDFLKVYGE